MAIAPELIVAGPVGAAPRHSLLAAAQDATNEPARPGYPPGNGANAWEGGFIYESDPCAEVSPWDPYSTGGGRSKSSPASSLREITYTPFVLESAVQCSSFGVGADASSLSSRALNQVVLGTSKGLESELWTGSKMGGVNPSFVQGIPESSPGAGDDVAATVLSASAESVQAGIIRLSSALADCGLGSTGLIHVTVPVGLAAFYEKVVEVDADGFMRTARGDVVVMGAGYTGVGPTGAGAPGVDQAWIFATGAVKIRVSDPWVLPSNEAEALDRSTNTYLYRGERTAAAYFGSCCLFATLVDWSATVSEGSI